MTVFVINKPSPDPNLTYGDVTQAVEYGSIVFVFDGVLPNEDPISAETIAWEKLRNFSDDDYLLWAGGDPVGLMIAAPMVAILNKGNIKCLYWKQGPASNTQPSPQWRYEVVLISL